MTGNDEDTEQLQRLLYELTIEHSDLDDIITRLSEMPDVDFLQLQRMKKRKLQIKDMMIKLKSKLIPDLDA